LFVFRMVFNMAPLTRPRVGPARLVHGCAAPGRSWLGRYTGKPAKAVPGTTLQFCQLLPMKLSRTMGTIGGYLNDDRNASRNPLCTNLPSFTLISYKPATTPAPETTASTTAARGLPSSMAGRARIAPGRFLYAACTLNRPRSKQCPGFGPLESQNPFRLAFSAFLASNAFRIVPGKIAEDILLD